MPQFGRPDSTILVNNWQNELLANNLDVSIDELTPDDLDWIRCQSLNAGTSGRCEIGLSNVSTPDTGTRTLRLRARKSGGDFGTLNIFLYEGAVERQSWSQVLPGVYTQYDFTVTAAITDYTDLRVKFDVTYTSGTNLRGYVSWAELEVPNVPGGGGPLMLMRRMPTAYPAFGSQGV